MSLQAWLSRPLLYGVAVEQEDAWIQKFHDGDRRVMEALYREHFKDVIQTVRRRLDGSHAETVTHEIFYRLLSNKNLRENFREGSFRHWLLQVAANAALDYWRRYQKEHAEGSSPPPAPDDATEPSDARLASEVEAKVMIDRFRAERLPPQWRDVFEARFLRDLSQRDAATELGMHRTTLVYQELRIRALLREFLLGEAS